jgi:SAM-dependent methyltransferase
MPWDQHGVPPALQRYLEKMPVGSSVLVPGCGSGYEVQTFAQRGLQPLAIDFSPAAVERARTLLGPLGTTVRMADFFGDDFGKGFDFIYERTFLCSLPTDRWPEYAHRMAQLVSAGGRLIGVFAYGEESEPPPFPLTPEQAEALFGAHFVLEEDVAIPAEESLPLFQGKERWQVWRRRIG